jgi:hypothetical protein
MQLWGRSRAGVSRRRTSYTALPTADTDWPGVSLAISSAADS